MQHIIEMEERQQIFEAAQAGKLQVIRYVLEQRPKHERLQILSSKTAGATPFIAACRYGHYTVAEYFIKYCGIDLEQVGSVIFDGETIDGVPPLWCAAAAGHLAIVKLLVQNGANVNSTTKTQSSPLRAACYDGHLDIVHYLINHGADIELANRHGHTCLMISCYKNQYLIVKLLIEKGADINRKSIKANTALHDCAESGALSIMKLLLSKGARFEVDGYGMSPLFAAAVAGHSGVVEYILNLPFVPYKHKVDALELLGATFVDTKKDMLGAHKYWKRALDWRHKDGKLRYPKPQQTWEVYNGRREVDNYDELEMLISDPEEMRMQALMVRERILGQAHPDTSYYIRYRGAVYADAGEFDRCILLWMYALNMQQGMLEPLSPLTQGSFLSFAELFWFMVGEKKSAFFPTPTLKFEDAYEVLCKVVNEVLTGQKLIILSSEKKLAIEMPASFHRLLVILLQLVTVMLSVDKTPEEEFKFMKIVHELVKANPVGTNRWSLIHLACSQTSTTVGRFALRDFPAEKTVELFTSVGADINSTDYDGNTPLHLIAQEGNPRLPELAAGLLSCGAHYDQINNKDQSFADIVGPQDPAEPVVANPMSFITLKCLCARQIILNGVPYRRRVPLELELFIEVH